MRHATSRCTFPWRVYSDFLSFPHIFLRSSVLAGHFAPVNCDLNFLIRRDIYSGQITYILIHSFSKNVGESRTHGPNGIEETRLAQTYHRNDSYLDSLDGES